MNIVGLPPGIDGSMFIQELLSWGGLFIGMASALAAFAVICKLVKRI